MKYCIVNQLHIKPEPIIIFETNEDSEFVHFVRKITVENEDEEPSITTIEEAKDYIREYCNNLDFYDEELFWEALGNVTVNEDDELDDDFLIFDKGTDKFEVWMWFEEYFNTQIGSRFL